jgi:hypothetical protein
MEKHMRVAFHESGHKSQPRQLEYLRARRVDARYGTGSFNPVAGHADCPVLMQSFTIEDLRWLKDESRRGWSGCCGLSPHTDLEPEDRECYAAL